MPATAGKRAKRANLSVVIETHEADPYLVGDL
jgi:hypothetical protein